MCTLGVLVHETNRFEDHVFDEIDFFVFESRLVRVVRHVGDEMVRIGHQGRDEIRNELLDVGAGEAVDHHLLSRHDGVGGGGGTVSPVVVSWGWCREGASKRWVQIRKRVGRQTHGVTSMVSQPETLTCENYFT